MIERVKAFGGLLVYLVSGFSALIVAAWLSTQFVGRALSQTTQPGAMPPAAVPPQARVSATPPINPGSNSTPHSTPNPAPNPAGDTTRNALTPNAAPTAKPDLSKPISLAEIIEDYTYSPLGKRDPFAPFERPTESNVAMGPLWPLQKFDLDQLKLVGIIWEVREPKAMILDPTGKGYVVKVSERIGRNNGYIARIREGEIIIVESYTAPDGKLNYSTKLMKLRTD